MKLLNRLRELRNDLSEVPAEQESQHNCNQHSETIGVGATMTQDILRLKLGHDISPNYSENKYFS